MLAKKRLREDIFARHDEPAAIVFSQNGVIRYIKTNENFPLLSVWARHPIPTNSLSSTSSKALGEITNVVEAPGHQWLEKSIGISLGEQTVAQKNGFRMTLLSAEFDDEDSVTWEPPRFRR